ncbi:hypothetical protein OV450_3422 [Actinobacteria bacterium OV450]|nr:hypothetical protein OV450_3422 [Actinobacteria bacterium OV450]
MSSIAAIRSGLASVISAAIPELRGYDTVPEVANLPAFVIEPVSADYLLSMSLDTTWFLDVFVLVARSDSGRGQTKLDAYVNGYGTKSIRQAVFNNPSLGLSDTDATITGMRGYGGSHESNGLQHIGAILRVSVTTGTA